MPDLINTVRPRLSQVLQQQAEALRRRQVDPELFPAIEAIIDEARSDAAFFGMLNRLRYDIPLEEPLIRDLTALFRREFDETLFDMTGNIPRRLRDPQGPLADEIQRRMAERATRPQTRTTQPQYGRTWAPALSVPSANYGSFAPALAQPAFTGW